MGKATKNIPFDEIKEHIHDPKIRQALHDHGEVFEQHNARLDAISTDIRVVEDYLNRSGVRREFTWQSNMIINMELLWAPEDKDAEKPHWRLQAKRTPLSDDEQPQTVALPLIDAPIEWRCMCHPHLAEFIKQFAIFLKRENM